MTPGELIRLYRIVWVLLSYGLDELIPRVPLTLPVRVVRRLLFWCLIVIRINRLANVCVWLCKIWGRSGSNSVR